MIRKAKSISKLFDEIKTYDLIIMNDNFLNEAFLELTNKSLLGDFSMTSNMIGIQFSNYLFDSELMSISEVVLSLVSNKKLDFNLKECLFFVNKIFNLWKIVGSLYNVSKFLSKDELKVLNELKRLPILELAIEKINMKYLGKRDIVVLGDDLFNGLEKNIINGLTYKTQELFEKGNHELDPIYLFDSNFDIVNKILEMVNNSNQDLVAIVLNTKSDLYVLIKSKFASFNINVSERLLLADDFSVREYLSIIRCVLSFENLKILDLFSISSLFGIELSDNESDFNFFERTNTCSKCEELHKILLELRELSFGDIIDKLSDFNFDIPFEFIKLLKDLDLFSKKISSIYLNDLEYFLLNFEIEIDRKNSGVLFVDPTNSTYINRELIFYVGMDFSWNKSVENTDKIVYDNLGDEFNSFELERDIKRFEILIQQGSQRFFFVPKFVDGLEVVPPFYFNCLFEENLRGYDSSIFEVREMNLSDKLKWKENLKYLGDEFNDSILDGVVVDKLETISSSSLSKFVKCPKAYSYSRLIPSTEKEYFLKGKLIHEFAEFYFENSDFVKKRGLVEFVDIIVSELKVVINEFQILLLRSKITFALKSIIEFIDKLKNINVGVDIELDGSLRGQGLNNVFFNKFGFEKKHVSSEFKFIDKELKVNGVIDLLINDSLIVDYKSSSKKRVIDIVSNASINEISSMCDFQPLVYLMLFRKLSPRKDLEFWYSFPLINDYNRLLDLDIEDEIVRVVYKNSTFSEFLVSKDCYDYFYETGTKSIRKILEFVDRFSFFDLEELTISEIFDIEEFVGKYYEGFLDFFVQKGMKESKVNCDAVHNLLLSIACFRFGKKWGQKVAFFFREDIDDFEDFVSLKLSEINSCFDSSFPFNPAVGNGSCLSCEFKSICLKQIESEESLVSDTVTVGIDK